MKTFVSREKGGLRNRGNAYMKIDQYKSVPGLISILIAVGTYVLLSVLFLLSYLKKGQAGMWIGIFGLILWMVALFGTAVGIYALRDPEAKKGRPIVGIICNLGIVFWLLFLYISHV